MTSPPRPALPIDPPIDPDRIPATFQAFARAILARPDPAPELIRLLGTLGKKAPPDQARDFALMLRRALPESARLARVTETFLREPYPAWYIRAVNDPYRNAAYRSAIEALVRPGMTVLEAGTGSGLFAMMAARAGAGHVYTCEKDPNIADLARRNIARNGLAERITVVALPHDALRVGEHLPRRADLLIHEFVGSHFAVENIGGIVRTIRDNLLTPEAAVLPGRFAAIGMLIGDAWPLDSIRVPESVEGLDVSAINLLAVSGISLAGPVEIRQPLSAPALLARLDLTGPRAEPRANAPDGGAVELSATAPGTATGVLQWIRHEFPDGSDYENRPDRACNWWPCFWPFPAPVRVAAGQRLPLSVNCTETEVFIDLVTNSGE